MYVRLGFAVAVHVDPDILLIDEVLSVGDEEFSAKCVAKIQEMKYRGVTLLFVTHQLDQVRNLCDRALWLDHGRTEAIGDPMRVVDAYLQEVSGTPPAAPAPVAEVEAAPEPYCTVTPAGMMKPPVVLLEVEVSERSSTMLDSAMIDPPASVINPEPNCGCVGLPASRPIEPPSMIVPPE